MASTQVARAVTPASSTVRPRCGASAPPARWTAAEPRRRDAGAAAAALREAGPAAEGPLQREQDQREEEEQRRDLRRGGPVEHAVPHAVDGLGERAVTEGRHR